MIGRSRAIWLTTRIGRCAECGAPTSNVANLAPPQDRELAVLCEDCAP